jgi:hypothetical protein
MAEDGVDFVEGTDFGVCDPGDVRGTPPAGSVTAKMLERPC